MVDMTLKSGKPMASGNKDGKSAREANLKKGPAAKLVKEASPTVELPDDDAIAEAAGAAMVEVEDVAAPGGDW